MAAKARTNQQQRQRLWRSFTHTEAQGAVLSSPVRPVAATEPTRKGERFTNPTAKSRRDMNDNQYTRGTKPKSVMRKLARQTIYAATPGCSHKGEAERGGTRFAYFSQCTYFILPIEDQGAPLFGPKRLSSGFSVGP
ncbi:hypothetical protein NQZ68_008351, partial [Dissostichus eleginoides]